MKYIIVLMLVPFAMAQGQHVVTGTVKQPDGSVVANATVYIPETKIVSVSDEKGSFSVRAVPTANFLLEISHVGYQTNFITLRLSKDTSIAVTLYPSIIEMQEVVITGASEKDPLRTSLNISTLSSVELRESGALNVSDALSRLSGVSQLSTGPGISKPVIRGLYGNRIQINLNGLRFDNQQWQDEHGLGLTDQGIERLEVIRGPASVLYGSDAIGGVVNIVEERPTAAGDDKQSLDLRLFSNTLGLAANYAHRRSQQNRWRNLFVGGDSHADYQDGNNNRVLNSRFANLGFKGTWGRQKEKSIHTRSVIASHSLFGFVFDSLSRKKEDARISRAFDGPHHAVSFLQVSSQNTWFKERSEVKFNAGFTSNLRLEDEGGGGISLSMLLNTGQATGQVRKDVGAWSTLTYGGTLLFQTNTNFGGRIIIPDAWNGEASAFGLYQYHRNGWLLESGLRYDRKFIETLATGSLNVIGNESPGEEIVTFQKSYDAMNFSLGSTYTFLQGMGFRINLSSGYRPGNLAELSSNGLHEGTLRWEIGNPNAKIEYNVNADAGIFYSSTTLRASISGYGNFFRNYFYLRATSDEYYGFAIYRYDQTDATLRGGEATFEWNIPTTSLEWSGAYSFLQAKDGNHEPLPFIPANRVNTALHWNFNPVTFERMTVWFGTNAVSRQNHPAQFETETKGYWLFNTGWSAVLNKLELTLAVNNLTNRQYYDHLSRYKYYGIANMGLSVVCGLKYNF